jgi:hypothetical protein
VTDHILHPTTRRPARNLTRPIAARTRLRPAPVPIAGMGTLFVVAFADGPAASDSILTLLVAAIGMPAILPRAHEKARLARPPPRFLIRSRCQVFWSRSISGKRVKIPALRN